MRRRGFTIVELLVSIVVASVALAGIYYYYSTVQYSMREQSRISQAQLGARLGMELIAGDIQRAGFLATPNSRVDPNVCTNSTVQIHPVVFHQGAGGAVFDRGDTMAPGGQVPNIISNPNINPDDVVLYGNYLNTDEYLAYTINSARGSVELQPLIQYPDPSTGDAATQTPLTLSDDEFGALFPTTAFLRIVNRHGFAQFTRIDGVSGFASHTINVLPAPIQFSPSQPCGIEGWCEGCRVNVVNGVWYRIEVDPADAGRTDLVRYFVTQDGQSIDASREVVVPYALDLQIWFRVAEPPAGGGGAAFDMSLDPNVPADTATLIQLGAAVNPPDGTATAQPEAIRTAIVRLTVRTRMEDPKFAHQPRSGVTGRIRSFDVDTRTFGAAHVRTYTTEVEMPNISYANLGITSGAAGGGP
ncbi:MAG: prepilin-type N-terminal cleavage/methylation domain-containing protein [Deltaproteobacteria bacterium]|nr:prepilin-type N-terminal cleavage/methylation domain-containing protein [Deltaproteobacteria bacterium]